LISCAKEYLIVAMY